ncbi:MAG: aspartate carbamoyltransferase [Chloroflexi bacterium]|nr:aspartate carbamoyltransferase [Chloroflexota bacterium]
MTLAKRSLVTIDDLSTGEIEGVFSLADEMLESTAKQSAVCRGKIMASLFFEPSTRTRLSFEAAMHRLGGSVISAVDIGVTSLAKGESIADMARVVGSYADIIVIRHPWEGAAKVVADYAGVPVVNAGDGGHQHPTQTLCDLYTIRKERGAIRGLKIALWGDLKYGRTIHSLIFALAKFGANILFYSSPGLEVPEHVIQKLIKEYGGELGKYQASDHTAKNNLFPLDAIYMTPDSPHQLAMVPDISFQVELKAGVDALYVTRPQKERFAADGEELKGKYPVVDEKVLKGKAFKKTLIMHPLPRVDELAYEVDADPRSMYFKQAAWGVPVRMALLALLLGSKKGSLSEEPDSSIHKIDYPAYEQDSGVRCPNPRCVSVQETEMRYIKPAFKIVDRVPLTLRCVYCEHGFEPEYVASSEWHHGGLENKKYHRADSHWTKEIKSENLIVFSSRSEAETRGFKPDHSVETGHSGKTGKEEK